MEPHSFHSIFFPLSTFRNAYCKMQKPLHFNSFLSTFCIPQCRLWIEKTFDLSQIFLLLFALCNDDYRIPYISTIFSFLFLHSRMHIADLETLTLKHFSFPLSLFHNVDCSDLKIFTTYPFYFLHSAMWIAGTSTF